MLLPSPVGIRDVNRPGLGFLAIGGYTEFGGLKFGVAAWLPRVQACLARGWSVGGLGRNRIPQCPCHALLEPIGSGFAVPRRETEPSANLPRHECAVFAGRARELLQ